MNPVEKSRRVDASIHHSQLHDLWHQVAEKGILPWQNADEVITALQMGLRALRKCVIEKSLPDVLYHVAESGAEIGAFIDAVHELEIYKTNERLPQGIENLAMSLFLDGVPAYTKICELGVCRNVAGLHAALARGDLPAMLALLTFGIRFKVEPVRITLLHDSRTHTKITRLFYRNAGYKTPPPDKEPIAKSGFDPGMLKEVWNNIDSLSPANFRAASLENREIYFYLMTKRVISSWGLLGIYINPATRSVISGIAGLESVVSLLFWRQAFEHYAKSASHKKVDFALNHLKDVIYEDFEPEYKKTLFTKPVCILTGDRDHAYSWILFRDYYILCDRLDEAKRQGITILKSKTPFEMTEEVFDWFVYTGHAEQHEAPELLQVMENLPLEEVVHLDMKAQKGWSCTEIALKTSAFVFFMIEGFANKKNLTKEDWQRAYEDSRPLYKHMTAAMRLYNLEGLLGELSGWKGSHLFGSFYSIDLLLRIAIKMAAKSDRIGADSLNRVLAEINRLL